MPENIEIDEEYQEEVEEGPKTVSMENLLKLSNLKLARQQAASTLLLAQSGINRQQDLIKRLETEVKLAQANIEQKNAEFMKSEAAYNLKLQQLIKEAGYEDALQYDVDLETGEIKHK